LLDSGKQLQGCVSPAAFKEYLGNDKESWPKYDATELAKSYVGPQLPPILIDQVPWRETGQLHTYELCILRPAQSPNWTEVKGGSHPNGLADRPCRTSIIAARADGCASYI
jgi:hypothetical protein